MDERMKYCIYLLLNWCLVSGCLAQGSVQDKVFTASINDSTEVDVYLRYDDRGEPDAYYCHVNTAVCEEGLCKLMVVDIFWDLLGNFWRYELPVGESLTKLDHQDFTEEDHDKLYKILSDRSSILRDYPADDLIERRVLTTSNENVDAVTSATRADIKDVVVGGAAYSTYVLWHLVNGPIAGLIAAHSKPLLTRERVDRMFYSENFYYQYYALSSIGPQDSVRYVNEVLHLVRNGNSSIPYFAVEKIPASAWKTDVHQEALLKHFGRLEFELQNFILNKIARVSLSSEAVAYVVLSMESLRDSQIMKALGAIRNNRGKLSPDSRERLASMSHHPNAEIAATIAGILEHSKG